MMRLNQFRHLTTVHMSKLPYTITKEQLQTIFKRYNPKEIHLPMTAGKDHAKGVGRIIFEDDLMAKRACIQMQGYVIDNMPIKLIRDDDLNRQMYQPYDVVIFRNLPYETEESEIFNLLQRFQVLRVKLMREPIKNTSLGYGYARFASNEAASKALHELKNFKIKGRKIRMNKAEVKDHHYKFIV